MGKSRVNQKSIHVTASISCRHLPETPADTHAESSITNPEVKGKQ
jgi:hypothetical protein